MPLIPSKYQAPFFLRNKNLHTIIPHFFFKSNFFFKERERIALLDKDFIDVDWHRNDSKKLVLMLHGLEGDTNAFYIKETASQLEKKGFDIAAVSYRGCSGTPNRLLKGYHSGNTEDIKEVIDHINTTHNYDELYIAGFSLGGALLLKYLGESPEEVAPNFVKGIAFSAPIDLSDAGIQIGKTFFGIYEKRFMNRLKDKLRAKLTTFPTELDDSIFDKFKDFAAYDDYHTAPTNGFLNAKDYYRRASAKPHLKHIEHQVLLVSALDDPFLPASCYPFEEAKNNNYLNFEAPQRGGHLGFVTSLKKQETYLAETTLRYFLE